MRTILTLVPSRRSLVDTIKPMAPSELALWRREERARLLLLRGAITPVQRQAWSAAITENLVRGFPARPQLAVSFYWPFKSEFDPRFAIRAWRSDGARAALPVVVEKNMPLEFRQWWPGVPVRAGVFGLPVPEGSPVVVPDVALIPPIGFDAMGYRLGYGAGYFDRTLAALSPQPLKIGVAFECARIATIGPQPHDIAMDFIVTQAGVHQVRRDGLSLVRERDQVPDLVAAIMRTRGLPRPAPP